MPLYDYDCANCGQRFEILRGVHADEPEACPLCGGGPIKKAFATPAIHFKGSGWAKKERRATSSPGASKVAGEGASGSSTDSTGGGGSSEGGTSDGASTSKESSKSKDAPAAAASSTSSSGDGSGKAGSSSSKTSAKAD
jgi:putative FmdB family regulatory protein